MMTFHAFRTRGVYASIPAFRKVVRDRIASVILPIIGRACAERVSGWRTPPEMIPYVQMDSRGIHGGVQPSGPGAENWYRVSRGVAGHWIQVRKTYTFRGVGNYKPALRLNRYAPSTTPEGGYGAPGLRLPPTGYRRLVWWPGIRPRLFEEHIVKELRPRYVQEIENALRVAVKQAQAEGT